MSFENYQWHDDYERESVMRAMCSVCSTKKGGCNECNECLDRLLRAGHAERLNETENQK
ncbi:hypothetical protein BvCmsKKNP019_04126 [Escherichia coli]|nr:hypothetical protein BvCmsKKNP019_04126 [Escherichia coli]